MSISDEYNEIPREEARWSDHTEYQYSDIARRGSGSGRPPPPSSLEGRVVALETHMEYVRRDLAEIKETLKLLPQLATRADLNTWRWQWIATGAAIVALVVGGITGGLALINKTVETSATPQAPIVIQVPAAAPFAAKAK